MRLVVIYWNVPVITPNGIFIAIAHRILTVVVKLTLWTVVNIPLGGGEWDLLIAHPPCNYLTCSGNRWFDVDKYGDRAIQRYRDRDKAIAFFMLFVNATVPFKVIENPIGIMSKKYRKPDQIIQPWQFGDNYVKSTCLWLFGLPLLVPTHTVKPDIEYKYWVDKNGKQKRQDKWSYEALGCDNIRGTRSKTFPGIAKAIATQYHDYISTLLGG